MHPFTEPTAARGTSWRWAWAPSLTASALLLGLLSCAEAEGGGGDGQGEAGDPGAHDVSGPWSVSPGDSLLEHLESVRVVRYPDSNLPPEVNAVAGGNIRVRAGVPPLAWERVWSMPAGWGPVLAANGNPELYWAPSPIPLIAEGEIPVPLIGGQPVPAFDLSLQNTLPERLAVWRVQEQLLLATGVEVGPIRDVGLEGSVPGVTEFASVDRGAVVTGRSPTAKGLATHQELDSVVRDALLLAAPGTLEVELQDLQAQRLEFAIGVVDVGWSLVDGIVRRVHRRGDGATFAVEILSAGEDAPERVWEKTLGAEDVGTTWLEAQVDLSRWMGKTCTLRLVTEPGPSGNPLFDYGLWAGLRFRGAARKSPSKPHIVLIDIDTLRADRLGSHGGDRGLTPELDSWAERCAVVFPDAMATAPWTLPSTVSMFTGLAVHQHGIDKASTALAGGADTLVTHLKSAGYETRGHATGGYLRAAYGFDLGFDVYETRDPKHIDWSGVTEFVAKRDSETPLFLFLHTYYVHAPYEYEAEDVDPDYDGPLRGIEVDRDTVFDPWHDGELELSAADRRYVEDLYDGLVRRMDGIVGQFLSDLEAAFGDEPFMVILTSDHGEAFLEHELYGHGLSLWSEVLRVPLLIRFPEGVAGVNGTPSSGLDLLPTVLEAAGIPIPEGLPGRALQSATGVSVRVAQYQADLRATMSEGFKLVEPLRPDAEVKASEVDGPGAQRARTRLFDMQADGGDLVDLSAEHPGRVEQLKRRLAWFLANYPERHEHAASSTADSDALDELRALGYLGGER